MVLPLQLYTDEQIQVPGSLWLVLNITCFLHCILKYIWLIVVTFDYHHFLFLGPLTACCRVWISVHYWRPLGKVDVCNLHVLNGCLIDNHTTSSFFMLCRQICYMLHLVTNNFLVGAFLFYHNIRSLQSGRTHLSQESLKIWNTHSEFFLFIPILGLKVD